MARFLMSNVILCKHEILRKRKALAAVSAFCMRKGVILWGDREDLKQQES